MEVFVCHIEIFVSYTKIKSAKVKELEAFRKRIFYLDT